MTVDLHAADRQCMAECREAAQRLGALYALLHGLYDLRGLEELIDDLRGAASSAAPGGPGLGSTTHRAALLVLDQPDPTLGGGRYPETCPVCKSPARRAGQDENGVRYRHAPGPLGDTVCRHQPRPTE